MQHPARFIINYLHFDKRFYSKLPGSFVAILLAGLILASVNAQAGVYPRDEIAFCPSGGPTGWMNYFDKRDREKRWNRYWRYRQYQQPVQPGYYRSTYHYPMFHPSGRSATPYYTPIAAGGQGFSYR
jgi:hypothetical protein